MAKASKPPEITLIETIRILPDDAFEIARQFAELGEKLGFAAKVRYAGRDKIWKCTFTCKKPNRLMFKLECREDYWHVQARLFNINAYIDYVRTCSDNIRNIIKKGLQCSLCNPDCSGYESKDYIPGKFLTVTAFTLDGADHKQCIWGSFTFAHLNAEEYKSVLHLIEKEYEVIRPS